MQNELDSAKGISQFRGLREGFDTGCKEAERWVGFKARKETSRERKRFILIYQQP